MQISFRPLSSSTFNQARMEGRKGGLFSPFCYAQQCDSLFLRLLRSHVIMHYHFPPFRQLEPPSPLLANLQLTNFLPPFGKEDPPGHHSSFLP